MNREYSMALRKGRRDRPPCDVAMRGNLVICLFAMWFVKDQLPTVACKGENCNVIGECLVATRDYRKCRVVCQGG